MHRLFFILFIALFIASCGPSEDEKASKYLTAAEVSFQQEDFNKAKLQLDSIKLLHPKAFQTRKAGNRLMLSIEQTEQVRSLANLDSMELAKIEEFEQIKKNYYLDKNEEYQEIGNYIIQQQRIESNFNKTFLRFQVDELGKMSMTSIYSGAKALGLKAIKVSTADGLFAETPESTDTFASTNLGITTEKADFTNGNDGGVFSFLLNNVDKKITITFIGDRNHSYAMSSIEKKAVSEVSKLAVVLYSINELQKAKQEANRKLKFIEDRLEKTDSIANSTTQE